MPPKSAASVKPRYIKQQPFSSSSSNSSSSSSSSSSSLVSSFSSSSTSSSSSSSTAIPSVSRPSTLPADDPELVELYAMLSGRPCCEWTESEIDRVVSVNSKRGQYRTKNCSPSSVASLRWFWTQLSILTILRPDVAARLDPPLVIVTNWGTGNQPVTWQADLDAFDESIGGNGNAGNFGAVAVAGGAPAGPAVPGGGGGGNIIDYVNGQDWFLLINPRPGLAGAAATTQQAQDANSLAAYVLGRLGLAGQGQTVVQISAANPPVTWEV